MKRAKLKIRLLRHGETDHLDRFLAIYGQSFNPDERVSPAILREVTKPSPDRPNRADLFAAFEGRAMVGGAVTLLLPAFGVVFGSYIFVDPALRRARRGSRILREVIRQEKQGPKPHRSPRVFRIYGEVTANSGDGGTMRWSVPASASFRPCGRSVPMTIPTRSFLVACAIALCAGLQSASHNRPCWLMCTRYSTGLTPCTDICCPAWRTSWS
jgi:hypothetical protein